MPITRSAKKALRQSVRRRARNLKKKDAYKAAVKEYKKLVAAKQLAEAREKLAAVYRALDKAAKVHVIHANKAGRMKSRLAHLLQ